MISLVWILSLDDFPIIITSLFSVSDYNHSIYLFKCAVVHQFIRFWCVGSRSLFTSFSCFHVAFFLNFTLLNESFSWIKAAHSIDHARVDLCLSGGGLTHQMRLLSFYIVCDQTSTDYHTYITRNCPIYLFILYSLYIIKTKSSLKQTVNFAGGRYRASLQHALLPRSWLLHIQ